jgi:hypothetical protein
VEVLRHAQIDDKINRIYVEIIETTKQVRNAQETQRDCIERLGEYYYQQYELGTFVDEKTQRKLSPGDICAFITNELENRMKEFKSEEELDSVRKLVARYLPSEFKRQYNHSESLNQPGIDSEVYFKDLMEHLDYVKNIKHTHLTRDQLRVIFEKIYDVEQLHEDYCDLHNIALIDDRKQNVFTGTSEDDPCKERVRMFEPEPREGILYEKAVELVDTCYDMAQTIKKFPLHDLQLEIKCARAIDSMLWYFQFHNNKKYRRDSYGWAGVMKKSTIFGTKAGAAKMTAVQGAKEREKEMDKKRKVTREQLANNFEDMPTMFMKFIEWHPYLILLHDVFAQAIQPIRADLSIDLRPKLRFRKGTITKEQVLKLLGTIKGKKDEHNK